MASRPHYAMQGSYSHQRPYVPPSCVASAGNQACGHNSPGKQHVSERLNTQDCGTSQRSAKMDYVSSHARSHSSYSYLHPDNISPLRHKTYFKNLEASTSSFSSSTTTTSTTSSPSTSSTSNDCEMAPRLNSQNSTSFQPTFSRFASVLSSIAQLPGKRVAKVAKKFYGNTPSSLSESDLAGVRQGHRRGGSSFYPGTPPPAYDAAMEGEIDGSESDIEINSIVGRELERRDKKGYTIANNDISRKFANQGHHLLTLSLSELETGQSSSAVAAANENSFTRQLYVHSLTYLLRALPQTLTAEEVTGLTSALPESVVDSITHAPGPSHSNHCCCHHVVELDNINIQKHPVLHKLARLSASSMVMVIRSLTPHLKLLVLQLWLFCQRYRVAERSVDLVKWSGDMSIWAGKTVVDWLDLQSLLYDESELSRLRVEMEAHGTADNSNEVVANVARNGTGRKHIVRYGAEASGRVVKDLGLWVGGVVSSGVGGAVEGFSAGLEKPL